MDKVENLKDDIETAVVSLYILSIHFMTSCLLKIVQKVLIREKYKMKTIPSKIMLEIL